MAADWTVFVEAAGLQTPGGYHRVSVEPPAPSVPQQETENTHLQSKSANCYISTFQNTELLF